MKTLKINKLAENRLNEKDMNVINGGYVWGQYFDPNKKEVYTCGCGCYYQGNGGSSTSDNATANSHSGLHS